MELILKSGQHLQPFLPTGPLQDPETDVRKHAGSPEGVRGRVSSARAHVLRWETAPRLPSSKATKFSYAREYELNMK